MRPTKRALAALLRAEDAVPFLSVHKADVGWVIAYHSNCDRTVWWAPRLAHKALAVVADLIRHEVDAEAFRDRIRYAGPVGRGVTASWQRDALQWLSQPYRDAVVTDDDP